MATIFPVKNCSRGIPFWRVLYAPPSVLLVSQLFGEPGSLKQFLHGLLETHWKKYLSILAWITTPRVL